jgi:hypothetical protein
MVRSLLWKISLRSDRDLRGELSAACRPRDRILLKRDEVFRVSYPQSIRPKLTLHDF